MTLVPAPLTIAFWNLGADKIKLLRKTKLVSLVYLANFKRLIHQKGYLIKLDHPNSRINKRTGLLIQLFKLVASLVLKSFSRYSPAGLE